MLYNIKAQARKSHLQDCLGTPTLTQQGFGEQTEGFTMTDSEKKIIEELINGSANEGITPSQADFDTWTESDLSNIKGEVSFTKKDFTHLHVLGLVKGRLGHYVSDKVDEKTPEQAFKSIKQTSKEGKPAKEESFGKAGQRYGKSDTFSSKLSNVSQDVLKVINAKIIKALKALDSSLTDKNIDLVSTKLIVGKETIMNSKGLKAEKKYDRLVITAKITVAGKNGKKASSYETFTEYKGIERMATDALAERIYRSAIAKTDVEKVVKGTYDVVFSPLCASTILHIADIHLSGTKVLNGESVYKEGLGKDVFSPLLIILNDPFIASSQATPFDKEGNPTEKFMAVDHGRLRCFFLDTLTGEKLNIRSNGCATYTIPESQYFVVAPSAENTANSLVAQAKDGYIVESFDEEAVEKEKEKASIDLSLPFFGYEIKDGKKGKSVKGTIKGRADKMLKEVIGLSSEREDCPDESALCPWFLVKDVKVQ